MKIYFNPFRQYKEYKQAKLIKTESQKACKNKPHCELLESLNELSQDVKELKKEVDLLTDVFVKRFNMPRQAEKNSDNGAKILEKKVDNEKIAATPLAEVKNRP